MGRKHKLNNFLTPPNPGQSPHVYVWWFFPLTESTLNPESKSILIPKENLVEIEMTYFKK